MSNSFMVAEYKNYWKSILSTLQFKGYSMPGVIKLISHSTQLSVKFFLLIIIKMPTIVGILIFISRKKFMLNSAVQEESLNW